jgi:AraC family transcriptional regulator
MRLSTGCFYGNVLKTVSTACFELTETSYASSLRLSTHAHDATYFCFVLEGSFTEFYERRSRSCRSSTLVFHPAGETHSDHFHTSARCFNIQINTQWLDELQRHSRVINAPADFRGGRFSFLATRLYREFLGADQFSSLVIEGLMLEMMGEASRRSVSNSKQSAPLWLRQAREILDERFAESLTLVALSERVGVHPVHLAREFRKFFHCTVGEYVRARRIEFACRQIANTKLPFSEIAHGAGFFDQSHFSRTLKRVVGLTPSEYRAGRRSR